MFAEKFYGGPADGHEAPADLTQERRLMDPRTGAMYSRAPDLDTAETRGWKFQGGGDAGTGLTHLAVQAAKGEALTLDQVGNLVDAARAAGWDGSMPLHGLLTWKGLLKRLEVRPS